MMRRSYQWSVAFSIIHISDLKVRCETLMNVRRVESMAYAVSYSPAYWQICISLRRIRKGKET